MDLMSPERLSCMRKKGKLSLHEMWITRISDISRCDICVNTFIRKFIVKRTFLKVVM